MWMSDRPRTQQNLAVELASLVDGLQEENYILFMDIFWTTMGREWNNIDVLRCLFLFSQIVTLGAER